MYEVLSKICQRDRIEFVEGIRMMLLSSPNSLLGIITIISGRTAAAVVDVMYAAGIRVFASSVILPHNQTSVNLITVEKDKRLIKSIRKVEKVLDIPLMDHIY